MNSINSVPIELSIVLGRAKMPINQLLKMGRGAVIELEAIDGDEVEVRANDILIATGQVVVQGDRIAVSITNKIQNAA